MLHFYAEPWAFLFRTTSNVSSVWFPFKIMLSGNNLVLVGGYWQLSEICLFSLCRMALRCVLFFFLQVVIMACMEFEMGKVSKVSNHKIPLWYQDNTACNALTSTISTLMIRALNRIFMLYLHPFTIHLCSHFYLKLYLTIHSPKPGFFRILFQSSSPSFSTQHTCWYWG